MWKTFKILYSKRVLAFVACGKPVENLGGFSTGGK
jgi:hypothetical protein